MTVYRLHGSLRFDPEPGAEPVEIVLGDDVEVRRSGSGERLLYRRGHPYGVTLNTGEQLGWCRVAGPKEEVDGDGS
jgi:hypothetical protein